MAQWKQKSTGQTALLLDGARRVGKSYIAEAFAKAEYKSYILVDFNRVSKDITDLFVNYLNDLDLFFMYLSNFYNTKLYQRETLIIFDEVQLFPKARAAIKYLVADGRYDYLETGSLMSIKKNAQDISPIEVKSGKNYALTSLRKFRKKYAKQLHTPYVLHTNDFKEEDGIVYLPLYMTPLL